MSLLYATHGLLMQGGGFDPLSISWDYYNQSIINFIGSNYIDSGIYNTYATKDFWHIWFKSTIADGIPPAVCDFWGCRTSVVGTLVRDYIDTVGVFTCRDGGAVRAAPTAFENGPIASTALHIYRTATQIKCDIIGGDNILTSTNLTKPTLQTTLTIKYGAFDQNGSITTFWVGNAKGIYVWGGDSNLTTDQINNMNTFMANL